MDTTRETTGAPTRRRVLGAGLASAAVTGLGLATGAPASAATRTTGGLTFRDGHGVTVREAQRWDWEPRLVYLRLGTPEITGWGGGGPGVNIVLPTDYDTSGKSYPVVHLYHGGGANADFRHWHSMGDHRMLLDATRDVDAIFVTPDISKGGWGLDARLEWFLLKRNWATFHLDQLIPWVDANLRTIPDAAARGVAGHSMGGFAALHHMAKRPDLFAAVSSFSGPSDLGHPSLQTYAYVSPVVDNLQPGALLGPPTRWSTDMVPVPLLKTCRPWRRVVTPPSGPPRTPAPTSTPSSASASASSPAPTPPTPMRARSSRTSRSSPSCSAAGGWTSRSTSSRARTRTRSSRPSPRSCRGSSPA